MQYYNISELKDIVSNISVVPRELGVHIFSFIEGDYEKENHKYLRMQSKNKRTHRIHNKITNRIRNLIKYENNSNACKNCTKQIMLGKWNYKDIPEAGHILYIDYTYEDRNDKYGVDYYDFFDEVYMCLKAHNAIIRFKDGYANPTTNYVAFIFGYDIKNTHILNGIYNSNSDWKGYDERWITEENKKNCYRCYKLSCGYYNINKVPTQWDWVRQ